MSFIIFSAFLLVIMWIHWIGATGYHIAQQVAGKENDSASKALFFYALFLITTSVIYTGLLQEYINSHV